MPDEELGGIETHPTLSQPPQRGARVPGSDGCHPAQIARGLPLGADHFVLLIAPTHSLNEIVERPALALGFPHDELCHVQFHYVELEPLATRRELNGQAFAGGDESEMLRQYQHRLAALKLAAATYIRPRFASLQRDIHDFLIGIGRMRLHKGFVARYREVAIHLGIAIKLSSKAVDALAKDADAAVAEAPDAGAPAALAKDAGRAAVALAPADVGDVEADAVDAGRAAVAFDASAVDALAVDAGTVVVVASDADAFAVVALAEDADAPVGDCLVTWYT